MLILFRQRKTVWVGGGLKIRILLLFTCRVNMNNKLSQSLEYLQSLPCSHQTLLEDYRKHLSNVKESAEENQNLFLLMVMEESRLFENHDEVYPSKVFFYR
jgi:hypothetical protein